MNKNSFNFSKHLWILKIAASVLAITLTVRYSVPLTAKPLEKLSEAHSLSADSPMSPSPENMNFMSPPEESTSKREITEVSPLPEIADESKPYETPADILEFEEEYLAAFSDADVKGDVEEVFFKTSGSTDTVQGIHIKNATATKKPDFNTLLNEGPELIISDKSEPVVLIFHTHTTESYLLSDNGVFYDGYETRSTDSAKNMVRVGDEICRVLDENGIGYIHDTAIYDENYEGAYARSRVSVEKYLKEYPTIQIVLDVHRDAIYYSDTSHCKPTAEIEGRKAAQIMIITGAQEGYISDFPYWEDNLRFALCVQKTAEDKYPGLMKPLYFCQRKYNMDTAKCSLLLEMGTDANTLDEAVYSAHLTGNVLVEIINRYCGD